MIKTIAEIGINYAFGNDKKQFMTNIKQMIDMAINAGCDYVKFQKRHPDLAVPEEQKNKEKIVPWRKETTTYLEYKKDIELSMDDFKKINTYCKKKGIDWFISIWDIISLRNMMMYFPEQDLIKIPSALITNEELVRETARGYGEIIISTGMSTEAEIERCVKWIKEEWREKEGVHDKQELTIMHCNSSYPAADEELNLNYIKELKEKYPFAIIGYSGHEQGISASIIAGVVGAKIIERHITLSRSNWGTDQAASIVYDQLYRLVRDLKKIDIWLGDGCKKVYESELSIRDKLRAK